MAAAITFVEEDIHAIEATYIDKEPPVEGEESEIFNSEVNNIRKYIYTNGAWTFVSSQLTTPVLPPPCPQPFVSNSYSEMAATNLIDETVSTVATTKKTRKPRTTEFVAACNRIIGAIDTGKNNDAKELFKSFVDKFIGNKKVRKVRKPKEVDEHGQVKCRSFYNQFVSDTLRQLTNDASVQPKDRMRITMERWHAHKGSVNTQTIK